MGKKYTIEVGVEYPWIDSVDDTFEVEVEFTDKELEDISQGGIRLMHNDRLDIDTDEFIEVLSKTAFDKLNAIAEKVASEKWGDQMLIANSASYNYFLPDDISEAIFNSQEVNEIYEQRNMHEEQSRLQFVTIYFSQIIRQVVGTTDCSLTHIGATNFSGIWAGPSIGSFEHNFPCYSIHCTIMIDGRGTEIEYTVRYFLNSYELELSVSKYNPQIVKIFVDRLNKEGYSIKKLLPIGEPIYSYAIYAEGYNPKDFVSTYMNVLDEAIKL